MELTRFRIVVLVVVAAVAAFAGALVAGHDSSRQASASEPLQHVDRIREQPGYTVEAVSPHTGDPASRLLDVSIKKSQTDSDRYALIEIKLCRESDNFGDVGWLSFYRFMQEDLKVDVRVLSVKDPVGLALQIEAPESLGLPQALEFGAQVLEFIQTNSLCSPLTPQ